MPLGNSLLKILGAAGKYSVVAAQAVTEAEAQVGPGNGATKKQVAVAYVLAAAHAGETVPAEKVQTIAAAVDIAANVANMLGAFGPAKATAVTVPTKPAESAAAAKV